MYLESKGSRGAGSGGLHGPQGYLPPPTHSSRSPFTHCLGIFLQQLHVPFCSPVASGQNRPVLHIYPLKCHPDESYAPQQGTAGFQAMPSFSLSLLFLASSVFSVQVQSSFTFYGLFYNILLWHYLLKNVFLMCFIACFINKLLKNVPAASDHLININKAIPDEAIIKSVGAHPR